MSSTGCLVIIRGFAIDDPRYRPCYLFTEFCDSDLANTLGTRSDIRCESLFCRRKCGRKCRWTGTRDMRQNVTSDSIQVGSEWSSGWFARAEALLGVPFITELNLWRKPLRIRSPLKASLMHSLSSLLYKRVTLRLLSTMDVNELRWITITNECCALKAFFFFRKGP